MQQSAGPGVIAGSGGAARRISLGGQTYLAAWKIFDVFEKREVGNVSKQIARTRWVLTRKMVDGRKSAAAR